MPLHESFFGIPTDSVVYTLFTTKKWDYPLLLLLNPILQDDVFELFLPRVYFIREQTV